MTSCAIFQRSDPLRLRPGAGPCADSDIMIDGAARNRLGWRRAGPSGQSRIPAIRDWPAGRVHSIMIMMAHRDFQGRPGPGPAGPGLRVSARSRHRRDLDMALAAARACHRGSEPRPPRLPRTLRFKSQRQVHSVILVLVAVRRRLPAAG